MLDLMILAAFVVYGITSGVRARGKASESLDEYFLAGRSLRGWQAGTSMAATQFAADTQGRNTSAIRMAATSTTASTTQLITVP